MMQRASRIACLAVWLASSHAASAQTTAPGPYYATPSWDITLPPATRFIVLTNLPGAVLDRETGLVWEREPDPNTLTFNDANRRCQHLTTGGRFGWRIPQTEELFSLLDPTQVNNSFGQPPALPVGHPFTVASGSYWVKDRAAPPFNNSAQILILFLHEALINNVDATYLFTKVWCTRGPGGSPTPW